MNDIAFRYTLIAWIIIAMLVFISLFFVAAPYGRYFRRSFGPYINGRLGWIIMEAPANGGSQRRGESIWITH